MPWRASKEDGMKNTKMISLLVPIISVILAFLIGWR